MSGKEGYALFFLLLGALNGDDRDFVLALYERYGDFLYKTAYDILKNQSDAEDAVQDVMCKIIKHLDKFESSSERAIQNQIVIYISSIARNTAIDAYRKRARTMQKETGLYIQTEDGEETAVELEDEDTDIEDIAVTKETRAAVQHALLTLSRDLQDAVNLVYLCGYSCVEAADVLCISDNAVRARIFKARKKLRTMLEVCSS